MNNEIARRAPALARLVEAAGEATLAEQIRSSTFDPTDDVRFKITILDHNRGHRFCVGTPSNPWSYMTAGLFAKHAFSRLEDAAAELRYAAMVERDGSAFREWAEGDESDCPLGATNSEFVARLRANARRRLADFDDYIAYAAAVIEGRPCGCCKKMEVSHV